MKGRLQASGGLRVRGAVAILQEDRSTPRFRAPLACCLQLFMQFPNAAFACCERLRRGMHRVVAQVQGIAMGHGRTEDENGAFLA